MTANIKKLEKEGPEGVSDNVWLKFTVLKMEQRSSSENTIIQKRAIIGESIKSSLQC